MLRRQYYKLNWQMILIETNSQKSLVLTLNKDYVDFK